MDWEIWCNHYYEQLHHCIYSLSIKKRLKSAPLFFNNSYHFINNFSRVQVHSKKQNCIYLYLFILQKVKTYLVKIFCNAFWCFKFSFNRAIILNYVKMFLNNLLNRNKAEYCTDVPQGNLKQFLFWKNNTVRFAYKLYFNTVHSRWRRISNMSSLLKVHFILVLLML